jgi:hypothetical protein
MSTGLVQQLSPRIYSLWEAWRDRSSSVHGALLTEDYVAVHPDGSRHQGRPTAEQMAAAAISGYTLSDLRASLLAPAVALATYTAEVTLPNGQQAKFLVGEVWRQDGGRWHCRYYQATLAK